jgi:hypothetical protein
MAIAADAVTYIKQSYVFRMTVYEIGIRLLITRKVQYTYGWMCT